LKNDLKYAILEKTKKSLFLAKYRNFGLYRNVYNFFVSCDTKIQLTYLDSVWKYLS